MIKRLYQLEEEERKWFLQFYPYQMVHWSEYDYIVLQHILQRRRKGRGSNHTYNNCWITADTETSKKATNETYYEGGKLKYKPVDNHVVAWTVSIRAYGLNIVTLYGHKPSSFVKCITQIHESMNGEESIIYFHNLAYDWVFLRKFLIQDFGNPKQQLSTKPHYPINIKFHNGITIKDSLILAQRSLDKWAKDMNVVHQKAKGKWDYNKLRNQDEIFSKDELKYIEHDTLALAECLDALKVQLHKDVGSIPFTATGIPREEIRKIGKNNKGKDSFNRVVPDYEQYMMLEQVYHGGYTHANRHLIDYVITDKVKCKDFTSSYPYSLFMKYPSEGFTSFYDCSVEDVLSDSDEYFYFFKLILINVRLKNRKEPMPSLQFSKCVKVINVVNDNGRILCADYVEILINSIDLQVIAEQYEWDKHICTDVQCSKMDYLPRWFTDYIFKLFQDKTVLKNGDSVAYAIAKAKLNSCYGMCVQKCIRDNLEENYLTGEYYTEQAEPEELYNAYTKNFNNILPYQWGVVCTSWSFLRLFQLGKLCDTWVYSDTDSVYGIGWNEEAVEQYNQQCKDFMISRGYGSAKADGKEYWLGTATDDNSGYSEFKVLGAKRYCGRTIEDGELHLTVAGVPKIGVKCLNDDINNFTKGFIFDGKSTGKLTHTYIFIDDIYIDENGNETGDSIDLTPCDYLLDMVDITCFDDLFIEEVEVQVYE